MVAVRPVALTGHSLHTQREGEHGRIACHYNRDIILFKNFLQAIHQALSALCNGFEDRLGFQQA